MVLWADIAEIETLLHGLGTPPHVGCRSHVPAVVTGADIVPVICLTALDQRIGLETVFPAPESGIELGFQKFIGDPVGNPVVGIIGKGITHMLDYASFIVLKTVRDLDPGHKVPLLSGFEAAFNYSIIADLLSGFR